MQNKFRLTLTLVFCLVTTAAFGQNQDGWREFMPGDVITADSLNAKFKHVKRLNDDVTATELGGDWTCLATAALLDDYTSNPQIYISNGWTKINSLIMQQQVSLKFGERYGVKTMSANVFDPFFPLRPGPQYDRPLFKADYELAAGGLYIIAETFINSGTVTSYDRNTVRYRVERKGPWRLRFVPEYAESLAVLDCDKANHPPLPPIGVSAVVNNRRVTLSWSAVDSDVRLIQVYRKAWGDENYTHVQSVGVDDEACEEILAPGLYIYEIRAQNSVGESNASNAVMVEVL